MAAIYIRKDGRQALEMRGKELRVSEQSQFDGSAWFAQGLSCVLVSVHGPTAAKKEDYSTASTAVRILHANTIPTAGGADRRNQEERKRQCASGTDAGELIRVVESVLDAVFIKEQFLRCVLSVDVTVMSADGSLAAVVANGVMCALLDAGVPCRTTVAAVCVAAMAPVTTTTGDSGSSALEMEYILDPTTAEEELHEEAAASSASSPTATGPHRYECVSHGCFVFANPHSGGGLIATSVQRNTRGCSRQNNKNANISVEQFVGMSALAERAAGSVFQFFRQCNVPLE